ncbi:MAG: sigma-54 dependent transcriptional regulator [Planctomycetaceae bacterium]
MLKPLIAILSQQPRYTSELPLLLTDGYEVLICDSVSEVEELLASHRPSTFLADFERVVSGGHLEDRLLNELQRCFPRMKIIMVTGAECAEPLQRRSVETDLVHLRDVDGMEAVAKAIGTQFSTTSVATAVTPQSIDTPSPVGPSTKPAHPDSPSTPARILDKFQTESPELRLMLQDLEIAAKHDVTILMIGETGSGKTFLSQLIHDVSPRAHAPFLHVACGALPAELIESELFGHARGAFTSAHADKEGKFLAAKNGTVLLDEIDVLGPEQQVKLLRVIETKQFEPVGSNQTHTSQARLVVASNLDLQPLVEQGRFRPDLYYRLNMLKFELLPLRKRKSDITPLARKFIGELSELHGVVIHRVESNLFDSLNRYPWPGNVRELENVIRRAVIYCRDGLLCAQHLPPHILSGFAGPTNDPSVSLVSHESESETEQRKELGHQIATTEREIIEQALYNNNFSRTNTAKELGISRVTLYNKMKKYDMSK